MLREKYLNIFMGSEDDLVLTIYDSVDVSIYTFLLAYQNYIMLELFLDFWFQIVEMRVHMDCAGCESKIRKALQKLDGMYIVFLIFSPSLF